MNKVTNNLVLELHVPNFSKTKKFYAMFGFHELWNKPATGGEFYLGYLVITREDALGETHLNFYGGKEKVSQHSHFKNFPADTPRGYAVEITIPVSDVEVLWKSAKDKLKPEQIAQLLALKRWGKKDFRVIDPHGFYVRFTELVDWKQ